MFVYLISKSRVYRRVNMITIYEAKRRGLEKLLRKKRQQLIKKNTVLILVLLNFLLIEFL